MTAQEFVAAVKAAPAGECRSYSNGNSAGTLWEKLWRLAPDGYWSKVCAPGCFVDWAGPYDEAAALREVADDLDTIRNTLF